MSSLNPGQLVTPSLQLVRRLGAGGMGTVWVARHLGLKTDVVVKFITGDLAQNREAVARFEREAAAASEVKSPHVVHMIDHGVAQNGLPYIAMELLEGEDLAARIGRERVMPATEVAALVAQVCRALARAHEKGIIHRDIKPENIFLCDTGDDEAFVKVLDFGIAKLTAPDHLGGTATGAMIGTPYYMSPEQMVGAKTIDHRTDLWSLGVVAFYAMTGVRPFDGETVGALAVAICSGALPRPSQHIRNVPPAIDTWFATACARDPAARFSNARAMADALVAAAGGQSVARLPAKARRTSDGVSTQAMTSMPLLPEIGQEGVTEISPAEVRPFGSTTGPAGVMVSQRDADHSETTASNRSPSRRGAMILAAAAITGLLGGGLVFVLTRSGEQTTPASATSPTDTEKPQRTPKQSATPGKASDTETPAEPSAGPVQTNGVEPKPSAAMPATKPATAKSAPTSSGAPNATASAPTSPLSTSPPSKPTGKPKPKDEPIE